MPRVITLIFGTLALILGIVALFFGFLVGNTSRHVTYASVGRGQVAHYLIAQLDNIGHLQLTIGPTIYIVDERKFTPKFDGRSAFAHPYKGIVLVYDSSYTTHVDTQTPGGTHLMGEGYHIVQITYFNEDGGQQVFTTGPYKLHPQAYDLNNWQSGFIIMGVGGVLAITGICLILIGFSLTRNRKAPILEA